MKKGFKKLYIPCKNHAYFSLYGGSPLPIRLCMLHKNSHKYLFKFCPCNGVLWKRICLHL